MKAVVRYIFGRTPPSRAVRPTSVRSQSQTFTVNVVETGAAPADVTVTIDLPMAQAALINIPMPIDLMTGNITASVTMRVL